MSHLRGGPLIKRRPGVWLWVAGLLLCLGAAAPFPTRAQAEADVYGNFPAVVGSAENSDTVLQLGRRTWNLEQVPDMAMVRFQTGKTLQSLRSAAGVNSSPWVDVKSWPYDPAENITMVQAVGPAGRSLASAAGTLRRALASEPGVAFTGPVYKVGGRTVGIADTLCVQFDPSVGLDTQRALIAQYGLTVVKTAAENHGLWKLAVPTSDGQETIWVCQSFSQEAGVAWASPNFFSFYAPTDSFTGTVTDDLYVDQWHLYTPDPLADPSRIPAIPQSAINAPGAWATTTGDPNMIVGVVDSGVDPTHPDLDVLPGMDALDGNGSGAPKLANEGHGTCVAGLIAAKLNGIGVVGVAPSVKILPVRLIPGGSGGYISDEQIRTAFLFCVDNGAAVINNSWGTPWKNDPCTTADDTVTDLPIGPIVADGLHYATTVGRDGKGSVIFFSAGNDRAEVDQDELTANPLVITVSASNNLAKRIWYSDYGHSIDVCAPSGDKWEWVSGEPCAGSIWTGGSLGITTTDAILVAGYAPGAYTSSFNGTSASCPIAAGVAALVLSVNPALKADEVRTVLERSATKIDPLGGLYDANGFSIYYGYGRVDAAAAVAYAKSMAPTSRFFLEGWTGYATVNGIGDLSTLLTPDRQPTQTNLYGFQARTRDGRTIFVSPYLLNINDRGVISGMAAVLGFDNNGALVSLGEIPIWGHARVSVHGAVYKKVVVNNAFKIVGKGIIGEIPPSTQTATAAVLPRPEVPTVPGPTILRGRVYLIGRQKYVVYPDQQTEVPGFVTKGNAAITGLGKGVINTVTDGLVKNIGRFTSTNLAPVNAHGTVWKGDGVLNTSFGQTDGGIMKVVVRSASPELGRLGTCNAYARNGRVVARSIGTHDVVYGTLTDIKPVEQSFDPTSIVFRSPSGSVSLKY